MKEKWRRIPGWELWYKVSNFGRVKSLARRCKQKRWYETTREVPEKILLG